MKTKYKVLSLLSCLLFTLLSFAFIILACWCLFFNTSFSISISLFFLFLSISILFVIFGGGLEIKFVEIGDDKLIFTHILGFSYKKYAFSEIVGFKTAFLKNKKRENLKLLIKTSSERVIEINGSLILNICEIERELKETFCNDNSIKEPIINIKDKLFIVFTICILICFLGFTISLL